MSTPKPVVTIGETMALMYSDAPGPLAHANDLTLGIGGAESNFAIALQRLGIPATWIGRIGDDSLGEKVARELRAEGLTVHAVIDPTSPTGLMIKERRTADATPVYRHLAARSTIVFAGYDEARLIAPEANGVPEVAAAIAALGPSQVVIKLGADGCYALADHNSIMQSAVPIRPVDTVGAGDAFVAGYVSECVAGQDLSTRLNTAVTVGAFACLTHGDWEGMPRRSELGLLHASEPVTR